MKNRRRQASMIASGNFMYVFNGISRPRSKAEDATEYSRNNAVDIATSFHYPKATIDAIKNAKTNNEIAAILERARITGIVRDFKE